MRKFGKLLNKVPCTVKVYEDEVQLVVSKYKTNYMHIYFFSTFFTSITF